jgi:penicillin-binding protein 1A
MRVAPIAVIRAFPRIRQPTDDRTTPNRPIHGTPLTTRRLLLGLALFAFTLAAGGAMLGAFAAFITYPKLPSLEVLTDYRPNSRCASWTADGELIGEFGDGACACVRFRIEPTIRWCMKQAILAAEDDRFYRARRRRRTPGVLRAALANVAAGEHVARAQAPSPCSSRKQLLPVERAHATPARFNEALLALQDRDPARARSRSSSSTSNQKYLRPARPTDSPQPRGPLSARN